MRVALGSPAMSNPFRGKEKRRSNGRRVCLCLRRSRKSTRIPLLRLLEISDLIRFLHDEIVVLWRAVEDAFAGIFGKHEKGDDSYYNIIKNKIIEESPLFP